MIGNQRVEKVLLFVFIGLFLFTIISMKVLGASEVPIDVEKNGYCKITYGDNWENRKETNLCYNDLEDVEPRAFSEKEFREVCPKNNFLSTKFNSDCFHKSGSIV